MRTVPILVSLQVHHILPAEQQLSVKLLGHVGLSSQAFTATAEALLDAGLAQVRAVCQLAPSPERLFTLLDMYKALTGATGQVQEGTLQYGSLQCDTVQYDS